jgi:cyclase
MSNSNQLHDIGNGIFSYIQGGGSWGWSNAGLITDGEEALLVDTLYDLSLTREMLKKMRDACPVADKIDTLVNTHAHGDHTYGNKLMEGSRIITSTITAEAMARFPPSAMEAMIIAAENQGEAGAFFIEAFGAFDYSNNDYALPTETFEDQLSVMVGDKVVQLIEIGPAHTHGDVLIHIPKNKIIYTGDVLFTDNTPLMSEGTVGNWIDACNYIIDLQPEVVVPGHGPMCGVEGVAAMRDYLIFIYEETKNRYDAGMDFAEATRDIALGQYSAWGDAERIAVNVKKIYEELLGEPISSTQPLEIFSLMSELKRGY